MVHVPYKGSAPAQQDVIGGRVPLLFDVLFSSMPFVKDNRMKVLALSSPRRAAANLKFPRSSSEFSLVPRALGVRSGFRFLSTHASAGSAQGRVAASRWAW